MPKPRRQLTRDQLYQVIWSKPLTAVAKELGISGNALAKICNRLMIPYPPRGYWAKKRNGTETAKPPLPPAPVETSSLAIGAQRPSSRRLRTRLSPQARREHLLEVAQVLVTKYGLSGASMKQIAAHAGISETQAYNYFRSREHLLVEVARRVFAHIREARARDLAAAKNHYDGLAKTTRTYLREIGHRGPMLQTILSSADVRAMLRAERSEAQKTAAEVHAQNLQDEYGVPYPLALGSTLANTALSLRAGKMIADKRISTESAERLCIAMILQSSKELLTGFGNRKGATGIA
jgi:AcrR family transcriptional regulator